MICPMMQTGYEAGIFMIAQLFLIMWVLLVPVMLLWRLDKIIKMLEKKDK